MTEKHQQAALARYRRERDQGLRLEFIKAAMQGLCAHNGTRGEDIAQLAVLIADKTLAEAEKKP